PDGGCLLLWRKGKVRIRGRAHDPSPYSSPQLSGLTGFPAPTSLRPRSTVDRISRGSTRLLPLNRGPALISRWSGIRTDGVEVFRSGIPFATARQLAL